MSAEQSPTGPSDRTFLTFALILVPCLFYARYQQSVFAWINAHKTIAAICGMGFVGSVLLVVGLITWNRFVEMLNDRDVTKKDPSAVYLGRDEKDNEVYLKESFRTLHTHILGSTSTGKTRSVILPWAIKDIENGSGMLIVDGKSDVEFLEQLYANVVRAGREKDFRLFSLVHLPQSSTFNPLLGDSPHEVAERVFSSFLMENPYYKAVQQKIFFAILSVIHSAGKIPTFALVHKLLVDAGELSLWLEQSSDPITKRILNQFVDLSDEKRAEQTSGLEALLTQFLLSQPAPLFNQQNSDIHFDEVLDQNLICYFQLPTMYYPALAEATGKLVLQSFQSAVAKRHIGSASKAKFFSCLLDDFQDYIYPGFASLLNKARSANIGVAFSHQSLGDLDKVGPEFRNTVVTNTNVKVIMRTSDPDTCEFYAKSFGTTNSEKVTERQVKGAISATKTGEGSVRDVKEYIYHPDEIKQLHRGQAIVAVPHPLGVKAFKIKLRQSVDLPSTPLPEKQKAMELFCDSFSESSSQQNENKPLYSPV